MSFSAEDVLLNDSESACRKLIICSLYENERPLKRVVGQLDWRLKGFLSQFLKRGWISGKSHEVVYVPVRHHQKTDQSQENRMRHLLLIGLGDSKKPIASENELLEKLAHTIKQLRFNQVVVSESSFPMWNKEAVEKNLTGIQIEWAQ